MKKYPVYLLAGFLSIVLFSFCNKKNKIPTNMKQDDYSMEWKVIDSLDKEGLPKSALAKVDSLYAIVKAKENHPQIAKCLIYKGKYMVQLEEDGFVMALNKFEEEAKNAKEPMQSMLYSMLGEQFSIYLSRNSYRINNRTETPDFQTDDIRTWSAGQLSKASLDYFLKSVKNNATKNINVKDWEAILKDQKGTERLRPTLYDFLANRALDFLMNEQNYLTEPVYKFYIDQDEAFADASAFCNFNFTSKDSISAKYQTLLLFQKTIQHHLNDETPEALIDADLKRLRFVRQNGVMEGKEDLYLNALEKLSKKYPSSVATSEILYWIARFHFDKGNRYQPNPENEGKFDWKKAYDLCIDAQKKMPDSYGAKMCNGLLNQILNKSLRVQMEQVNLPNEPMLASISHRNIPKVYAKIVRLEERDRRRMAENRNRDEMVPFLNSLEVVRTWELNLPQEGDYRQHTLEMKVDGLPLGFYAVLVADNDDFSFDKKAVSYLFTHVSNISYWTRRSIKGETEFFVVHRKTGEPLEKVRANYFVREYNQQSRKYDYIDRGEGYSDKDGYLKPNLGTSNFQVRFVYNDDVLNLDDSYSNYYHKNEPKPYRQTSFFLDRAIYRPGQTVYFKGVLMNFDKKRMPTIAPNQTVAVTLKDVNYQDVETKTFTTNEYGTFNGSFRAPTAGLLGQMHIQSQHGSKVFRVEEYKRPKFEVNFEPVKVSYKIGENVTVNGAAKAFAGSNIDGAKVRYRVVRQTIYPYWRWWGWYPPNDEMEITNGETMTDAEGKFEVKFDAIPDRSAKAKNKPQFNYRIYADVVDITGETRSTQTNVSVGHIALSVGIAVPTQMDRDGLGKKEFEISSKNLNGEFENSMGEITVHKLNSPNKIFRKKYWNAPDQFVMTKEEFDKNFPFDVFKDEDKITNWTVGKEVLKTRFDVSRNAKMVIGNSSWDIGSYVLTLNTQDKYGEKIEVKKYFTLYDLAEKKIPSNIEILSENEKPSYQPGALAKYFLASAHPSLKVLHEIEMNNEVVERKWLTINNLERFQKSITEEHRGNIGYHFSFVKNNRDFHRTQTIQVPWKNKELNFEYTTFRDKLKPGQEEEWRIKISGNKKEKIAAEMLAAMYDASLDEFVGNYWGMNIYPMNYVGRSLRSNNFYAVNSQLMAEDWQVRGKGGSRYYRKLNWFGFSPYSRNNYRRGEVYLNYSEAEMAAPMSAEGATRRSKMKKDQGNVAFDMADGAYQVESEEAIEEVSVDLDQEEEDGEGGGEKGDLSNVKVRTNLDETVFFLPEIMTDENGDVIVKFTMNEALTKWKFLGMAHTKDLKFGFTQKEIVTQKELMVMPNAPRFFREGDVIEFTAKVSNLTEKEMNGTAKLELFDALTNQPINLFANKKSTTIPFVAKAGQSAKLDWQLRIPFGKVMAVKHRVVAQAGDFSDGEESSLPVLTNRMLVTETMPLPVRGKETKTFSFDRLKNASSSSLQHHEMTLEFTSNPAWYAVQALPYLMEYPHSCTEQLFNRYYANTLASNVANAHPKVKKIFDQWKNTDAMLSNLSKNQELKSALLEETPWVLAAQSEEEQKKNIGLLFDLTRMSQERADAITRIAERQLGNGGFAWFPGGRDNWYITQYLVEGMGHLEALGVDDVKTNPKITNMVNRAVTFIDARIDEQYQELLKRVKEGKAKLENDNLNNMAIHYLYARSFFLQQKMTSNAAKAKAYYLDQSEKFWLKKGMYQQGMIALALHRQGQKDFTKKITKSLKERSLNNDEFGMYWKYETGYYWYQLPIETHALMIEVFDEVANDAKAVDDLKVWLLKNKQTTNWKTTKATSAAVYALLRRGANWLLEDSPVKITVGDKMIDQSKIKTEAGTGYFKMKWKGEEINPSMADVKVENPNSVVAWGAMYWQYFEDLDKITHFEDTPLKLSKKLFKKVNSDRGPVMTELKEGSQLNPGDKLQVRIELRVDRIMEYVHMKDMRASGFEPLNVLSSYKWQGGLGYYESTSDASTNFFISYLPKGTYVFEYPLVVNHKGNFSNGVTTIQSMYAPEFTSHSEGIRVEVK